MRVQFPPELPNFYKEIKMIEKEVKEILTCDRCLSKIGVKSYCFELIEHDGHRNDTITESVELCHRRQEKGYKALKSIIP